jgi:hypothetical protein
LLQRREIVEVEADSVAGVNMPAQEFEAQESSLQRLEIGSHKVVKSF